MIERNALTVIDGDARIADTHIQQALGYVRVNNLHRVIKGHEAELERYGAILSRTGKIFGAGRPTLTYLLNEAQAVLVCMFARTPRAADARQMIVEVFMAWRKGQLSDLPTPKVDPFAAMAQRSQHVADHLMAVGGMDDLALRATHLPIWKNGRRPGWWSNIELRRFLTSAHRQMTLQDCRDKAVQIFGVGVPSTSGIHRYWAQLDAALGPGRAA